jgi:hypothetical protein
VGKDIREGPAGVTSIGQQFPATSSRLLINPGVSPLMSPSHFAFMFVTSLPSTFSL